MLWLNFIAQNLPQHIPVPLTRRRAGICGFNACAAPYGNMVTVLTAWKTAAVGGKG